MMATAATTSETPSARGPMSVGLTRHHVLRYAAAVVGLIPLLLFYQPWVDASLTAAGETQLSGVEMARGDAQRRVDRAVFGGGGQAPVAGAAAAAGAATGGLALPTRRPTVAAGAGAGGATSGGLVLPTRQPTVAPASGAAARGAGGLTLPTRVPTVAPGSGAATGGFGSVGAVALPSPGATVARPAATGGASPPPAPSAPITLPKRVLYVIPLAALGIMIFSVIWDRLSDPRDRRYGRAWTLLCSYGGALLTGYVVWRIVRAGSDNVLLGEGVGSVQAALPALWGTLVSFSIAALCLSLAWLSPAPPAPDPYWRARGASTS